MKRLEGKVSVVTGASKGIGAAIAKALAAEGSTVIVNYAGDEKGAARVVAQIETEGGRAVGLRANVANAAEVRAMFAAVHQTFARLDVLVNNAGIFVPTPIETIDATEVHRLIDTNVVGPLLCTHEALKYFGEKGGAVINMSSVASENPVRDYTVYSATKGAIDTITRDLAATLGPRKIRVNSIAPGGVDTEGTRAAGLMGADYEKLIAAHTPLGRVGKPEDIASVAVFLASDDAAWVTGARIVASGGLR